LALISALACVLSLICATSAYAQTVASVTGRVTDRQGAGVPGATVTLYARERPAESIQTVTDGTGAYRFERLAPGEYLIAAEASGFARTAAQQVRVESGGSPTLDISLEIAGVREEVVVTAAGTPQAVDEVSKAITVVDQRELDERDEFSIPEALRTVPGLRVRQLGGPGTLVSIRSRGLRNQDTAVLVDGQRLRDPASPQGDASALMGNLVVTDVSRIEVLRGSGSSLYGTNAIGGVINIVSNEGGGPFRGNLLLEGGSLGLFRGRAQVAGSAGEGNRVIYSAGLTHVNISRGVDGDDASRTTGGQGRVVFRFTPKTSLSARVYATDAFVQLNDSPDVIGTLPLTGVVEAVPLSPTELRRYEAGTPRSQLNVGSATFIPSANDPDASGATRFFTGAIIFAQQPTESLSYTIAYQGLTSKRSNFEGPGGHFFEPLGNTRLEFDGRIHVLSARTDFRLGSANLINVGYEFEDENFVSSTFAVNPAGNNAVDVTQRSNTLFVQHQLRFLDGRLQFSAAFRTQFFSLRRPQFTPAANAPYRGPFEAPPNAYTGDGSVAYFFARTNTKLRAHVGNGYRAPSLFERFGSSFSTFSGGFSPIGDPRLRPERSIAFDAGVDQEFFDNRVRASATYFYTRLQEIIDFDFSGRVNPATDPFGRFFGYLNTRGGLARGVELSATLTPTETLDLFTSYTYTNSDERVPNAAGIRSFIIPDHQFSLVATQRIGRRVLVNVDFVASSNYLAPIFPRIYRFDGLVKADLGASYTLPLEGAKAIRFYGKVENLFDQKYFEGGFRTPGRAGVGGAAFSF
jgi:iron complex outermembrane receptor protein